MPIETLEIDLKCSLIVKIKHFKIRKYYDQFFVSPEHSLKLLRDFNAKTSVVAY